MKYMNFRFFFGVFVGFILASLFFFFFFRGASAQTSTTSPQNRVAAYYVSGWGGYVGDARVDQDHYTAANYYAPAEYDTQVSYSNGQTNDSYERAYYKAQAQSYVGAASYGEYVAYRADDAYYDDKSVDYDYTGYEVSAT